MKNELLAALLLAKETIQTWHGDDGWEIYEKHSPEMKQINKAIENMKKSENFPPESYFFMKVSSDHWIAKNKAEAAAKELAGFYDRKLLPAYTLGMVKAKLYEGVTKINQEYQRCKDMELKFWDGLDKEAATFAGIESVFIISIWRVK